MEFEQLCILIKTVAEAGLSEFSYEENGVKISMEGKKQIPVPVIQTAEGGAGIGAAPQPEQNWQPMPQPIPQPMNLQPVNLQPEPQQEIQEKPAGNLVTSPLVGVFYAAPAEDADPFIKVGDVVKEGQVVAIVEAMKLMNEIESDFSGTVAEILVKNGQSVEYGQPLFRIVP